MRPRRPDPLGPDSVAAVGAAIEGGAQPSAAELRTAVRYLLWVLADRAPGRAVEVRVPPVAAAQCVPGPVHTRGTPPNVIEIDPVTWFLLATGRRDWASAVADGAIRVSGPRADLSGYLPLA